MPGVFGLVTRQPAKWAESQLQQMLSVMRHTPSYVCGTWSNEAMGIYVGWTARVASFDSTMPLKNEANDRVLIFSGEDYSAPDVVRALKQKGHTLNGNTADYLIHKSEEESDFPKSLNGKFHGILIDHAAGSATLFNDRYGMHRIYYHQSKDGFYFSAEAKSILAVRPDLRSVDAHSLGEFVTCGCVLENRTLFQGVEVLPTASAWTIKNGELKVRDSYFDPSEWESQGTLEQGAYYRELREVFSTVLPKYLNGPEQVAMSLTGGLDTRMIMAWAETPAGSLPSYTFGGPFRDCQDVIIARKVAKICQQPHQVIHVGDEFLSRFAHYADRAVFLSDGCTTVNRAADLYANEEASHIAPVRLTGNYGSEILRRLRAFKPGNPPSHLFCDELLAYSNQAAQTFNKLIQGHAVSFAAFRQAPWYQYGLLSLEQTQLAVRSPFLDNDLVRTAFRAPKSEIVKNDIFEDNDDCARLIADGNMALHNIPTDRGLGGRGRWTAPIARGFLEFTFKAEYAYDYGMPQWLARIDHACSPLHLERLFLGRHKFCHYRVWYRDALSKYVQEILLDPQSLSRPYLRRGTIEAMVSRHLRGDMNCTTEITQLLTLELLHRQFIDAR
jgi:asparagine synthase (glutamine-hydrolysing)